MSTVFLAPSLLSADFSRLYEALDKIEHNGGSYIHIDVMDGSFVPAISFGQPVVKSLRKHSKLPFDVHLMVQDPMSQIQSFAEAGADLITFHWEAAIHHHAIISLIHSLGKKAGVAIVPSTPVSVLEEILPMLDLVLVMSVNPGAGGQSYIPSCGKKVALLRKIREEQGLSFLISVDGGMNSETARIVLEHGADIIVSGSSFFDGSLVLNTQEGVL